MTILFAAKTMDSRFVPATPEPVRIASLVWALDGIRWARQLDDDHLSFGMASFFMADWSLLRDVSPRSLRYVFFFKTWMSSKENFNPQRLGLFALTELRNTCTCPEKVPKQLWVLYHPLSTELVDQLIQIVSNSQWWSGILKTSPAN